MPAVLVTSLETQVQNIVSRYPSMGSWFLFPRTRLATLSAILMLETHLHFVLRWNQQTPHVRESQDKAYFNIGCETSHPFFILLKVKETKIVGAIRQ